MEQSKIIDTLETYQGPLRRPSSCCAHRGAAVSHCQHGQHTWGWGDDFTWRGWQWGPTRAIAARTQVPPYYIQLYIFCFLLVSWHHGPTPLSTYVVNKRENCTRSGRQLGPCSSTSICVFEVWALQSFSWAMFSLLFRGEQGINWAGCGLSSPGQISNPDINFFQAENS